MTAICDDGIACDQSVDTQLNEHGVCAVCREQREYEDDKFPKED